jgi:hypothetical protein
MRIKGHKKLIENMAKAIAAEKVQSFDWHDHIITAIAALEEVYKHLEGNDDKDHDG